MSSMPVMLEKWIPARTFAVNRPSANRCRLLARRQGCLGQTGLAFPHRASIRLKARNKARNSASKHRGSNIVVPDGYRA